MGISKEATTPLYQRLVDSIKSQIADGTLKENDRLCSEQEISKEFQVSRITVRKALEILADEGYIVKRQGVGTFIASKKLSNRREQDPHSFTEICLRDGKIPSTEVLLVEWVKDLPAVSKRLQVPEKDSILKVVRLRKSDGFAVMVEEGYFPKRLGYLVDEDLTGSTIQIFRDHGTFVQHAFTSIELCYATSLEAEKLGVRENQALLLQRDITYDQNDQPIHYTKMVINPERYKYTVYT